MTRDARATTFVTGPAGVIGTKLVKVLMARGHQVVGLTPSAEAAQCVRRAGAVPVMGGLLEPEQWQDEAAAEPCRRARLPDQRLDDLGTLPRSLEDVKGPDDWFLGFNISRKFY